MPRKVGQIIARGDRRWLIRVYLGRDQETNKRKYHNRTIHGPMRGWAPSNWHASWSHLKRATSTVTDWAACLPMYWQHAGNICRMKSSRSRICKQHFSACSPSCAHVRFQRHCTSGTRSPKHSEHKCNSRVAQYGCSPVRHFLRSWQCGGSWRSTWLRDIKGSDQIRRFVIPKGNPRSGRNPPTTISGGVSGPDVFV